MERGMKSSMRACDEGIQIAGFCKDGVHASCSRWNVSAVGLADLCMARGKGELPPMSQEENDFCKKVYRART